MGDNTKIEWTGSTWNPTLGCSKKSPGCKNCYAIYQVHRMAGNPNKKMREANAGLTVIQGGKPNWTGVVRLIQERLQIPLRKRKPTTFFVNSLSDLFHENLPLSAVYQVLAVISQSPQHRFQVLTKEAERMQRIMSDPDLADAVDEASIEIGMCHANAQGRFPLPNLWLGVSVENTEEKRRIEFLRNTPAAIRFLSLEPLLENLGKLNLDGIHWGIDGGESGRGARPAPPEWYRNNRDQFVAQGKPYFHKQNGEWHVIGDPQKNKYQDVPVGDGTHRRMFKVGKKAAGALLDGRLWREFPEAPHA